MACQPAFAPVHEEKIKQKRIFEDENDQHLKKGSRAPQFDISNSGDVCDRAHVFSTVFAVVKWWKRPIYGVQVNIEEANVFSQVALCKERDDEHAKKLMELGLLQ